MVCASEAYLSRYHKGYFLPQTDDLLPTSWAVEHQRWDLVFENRLAPEGYLYQKGIPVNRCVLLEFWSSTYDLDELKKVIGRDNHWVGLSVQAAPPHQQELTGSHILFVGYFPTDEEFQTFRAEKVEWYFHFPDHIKSRFEKYTHQLE